MLDTLVDLTYEASVNCELWPSVLDGLSRIADAEGGVLFAAGSGAPQWTASKSLRSTMRDFISEGWAADNLRAEAALRLLWRVLIQAETDTVARAHDRIKEEILDRANSATSDAVPAPGEILQPLTDDDEAQMTDGRVSA